MDSTYGYDPTLPVDLEGSANANVLHEVTFGTHMEYPDGSVPMVAKTNSGRMSPVRGRTMKEYDQQLTELKKENFSLKLRIYFLEERMQQKFGDSDVFKTNIELKVELESVKNELADKQELLKKASNAMETMSKQHELEISGIRHQIEEENQTDIKQVTEDLNKKLQELDQANKALDGAAREVRDLHKQLEKSQTEYAEFNHKTQIQIQDLKDALAAKESSIGDLQIDKQKQDERIKELQKDKAELDGKLQQVEREVNRKDRDIEDVVDDQNENLKKLQMDVEKYKQQLTEKERMIGKLEDLMKTAAKDKKDLANKVKEMEDVLEQQYKKIQTRDKALVGLRSLVLEKTKEGEDITNKLQAKEEELKNLQKDFQNMKLEKSKALEQKHEEVNYLEERDLATQAHLKEQEAELEKLMRTLGKKEGELESFRDLLNKAENALKQSEEAVDSLQRQLKKDIGPSSDSKHYQTLYEDAQKQVEGKDQLVKSLTESLQDKDKQIQYCMEIFKPAKEDDKKSMDIWMKELQDKLREKNKALEDATAEKYRILDEKDGEIRKLKQVIRERDRDLDKANQTLLNTEETIDGLEKECRDKDLNMQQLVSSLKSSQRSLEDALDNHARVLGEKDNLIKRLQNTLAEKERSIEASQWSGTSNNEELNRLKKLLKEKDDLLQELMAEQSKATVANAEALNNMLKKLKGKDEDMRELMDRTNKDVSNLQKEIQQLQAELNRKQLHSKSSEDQINDLELEHRHTIDKLAAALKDKDKTIETLVESGQEKDKLIQRLQQVHVASRGTLTDNNRLRDEIDQLRHELCRKQDLIEDLKSQMETDGSRSPKAGLHHSAQLEELRLQLAVKNEALRAAKQTEEDLREQINALRKQLETAHKNLKEVHTSEKQVYYMRENPEGKPQQYPDVIGRELDELHRIQETEKQLLSDLKEKCDHDKCHSLETELSAIKVLKKELEAGIERNNKLQADLEKQRSHSPRKGSFEGLSNGEIDDMKRHFNDQSSCSDTQGTSDSRRSSLGTPRGGPDVDNSHNSYSWPLTHGKKPQLIKTWSPSSDSDIQLNRQSLSEMSAPMLRKFIRQMKHQFEKAEKENDDLRRQVDEKDGREIPGRNDSDVSSLPVMHLEIERLTTELNVKNDEINKLKSRIGFAVDSMDFKDLPNLTDLQNENLKLKVQLGNLEELNMLLKKQIALNSQSASSEGFNPELIVQMANEIRNLKTQLDNVNVQYEKNDVSCQTSPWSEAVVTQSHLQAVGQSQRKGSKIPQMQKSAPMKANSLDRESNDILKTYLMEARSRIQALEAKLEATEGTVRLQTKKMKYYRNLLEEHGLVGKSPMGSRSNSESNLVKAVNGRSLSKSSRTLSYDNIPELLSDCKTDSTSPDSSENYNSYGETDNVKELKEQIEQLKKGMRKYKSQVAQRDTTIEGMSTQTLHDMDDTFIPRQSLRDLQCKLAATEENNAHLRQKVSSLEKNILDLKLEIKNYQAHVNVLETEKPHGSPTKRFIESQKSEIMFLRKKLSDTQNSCVQLEGWLNELNDFLNELMHVGDDGNHSNMRGIKQKVDKSRHIIQSMSSTLLEQDITDASLSMTEDNTFYRDTVDGSDTIGQNIQSLTEELQRKNMEVQKLTEELKKKNSRISNLSQSLLAKENKFSLMRDERAHSGSVTSGSSDGNVYSKATNEKSSGHPRNTVSPIRSPTSTVSDGRRFSDMSNFDQTEKSIERLRHRTDSSEQSHAAYMQSVDNVNLTSGTMDSSARSAPTQDSSPRSSLRHPCQNGLSDFTCASILGSEERMIDNRHDYFDASHTPTYLCDVNDVSFPSLHLEKSQAETGNSKHVSFYDASRCESPINNVNVLTTRLNALEDLNRTLKDEVSLYEKMCTSMGTQISPRKSMGQSDCDKDLLLEHLQEIRALRTKLERSLDDSDRLREALERDMKKNNVETGLTSNVYLYSQHQSVVRELQITIQKLEQELADKDDLINNVRVRAEKECSRNNSFEVAKIDNLSHDVEKLKQLLNEKEETIMDLNSALARKESDVERLRKSMEEKEDIIHKLRLQLNQTENALQERFNDQSVIQKLEKQILEKEHSIKEKMTSVFEKEHTIIEKLNLIKEKEKIIEEKVVIIHEMNEKSSENQKTLVLQQRRIEELDNSLNQMRKKLELQEQSLHQQEQKLKEQYDVIKQQDQHVKQQYDSIKQRDDEIKQLESAINRKQEKIRHLEHAVQTVEDEKHSLESSYRRREEQCQQREDRIKTMEEQRKTENDKIRKQELNLRKAAKEIRRLNNEVKTLREQNQENKDLNQTLKLELSVYEKLEKQEGDYDTKGAFDIRDLLTEIRHLRVQLERCIETNSALRQKLEEHLAHQNSPRSHPPNAKSQSPARSGTTTGTDATDGQPSPERPRRYVEHSQSSQISSVTSHSQNSSVSDDHFATNSLDIHTWPGTLLERKLPNDTVVSSQSMPDPYNHMDLSMKKQKSEGNLSYYVDDPPSKIADFTFQSSTIDSDLRNLFAIGKLDDYEKLKKENYESLIVLNGVEARIQERLKVFKSAPVSESLEYSTLKELSMSVQNLKICLNEEKSLITCFWTTTLPKGDPSGQKMLTENEALRNELFATRTKYELMSKLVHDAEERLHASNRQKQTMEDIIYKQLKRTTKVMAKARTNFEKAPQFHDKENIRNIHVDMDDIESSVDTTL